MGSVPDTVLMRLVAHLPPKQPVVVAASGGPDSQALLALVAQAAQQGKCVLRGAVGIDHGLRAEARAELAVAKDLCARLQVPFAAHLVDVRGRGNLLARARRARYAALREQAAAFGATRILLGHTRDDVAETMLWHLLRGSAPAMPTAMPTEQGPFVRPLLGVARDELRAWLVANGIAFATDPSNEDPRRMRARMRQTVWPAIEAAFPGAKQRLLRGLAAQQDEGRFVGQLAARHRARATVVTGTVGQALSLAALRRAPRALWPRVLRSFLLDSGGRPRTGDLQMLCEAIASPCRRPSGRPPRQVTIAGVVVGLTPEFLWICTQSERRPRRTEVPLPPVPATALPLVEGRWIYEGPVAVRVRRLDSLGPDAATRTRTLRDLGALTKRRAMTVAFARQRLHVALFLRPARGSEWLDAYGAAGRVQVSQLLSDAHVPWVARPTWPVIATAREPVWLVGIRRGKQATIDVFEDSPVTLLEAKWVGQVQQP